MQELYYYLLRIFLEIEEITHCNNTVFYFQAFANISICCPITLLLLITSFEHESAYYKN